MPTSPGRWSSFVRGLRKSWRVLVIVPAAFVGALAGLSWWLTAPLEDRGANVAEQSAQPIPAATPPQSQARRDVLPDWPSTRLEGMAAKTLLLDTLKVVAERLDKVKCYTAVFHKQERISGTLGPEQVMEMKVRQHPFALYFKFVAPKPGKEVVYAEGHHDNKVIAHTGGVAGWLVPRLAVAPDHPLALADNRHAVTEAGLANLTAKLIRFRRMDLDDTEAETVLDRTTGPDGHPWLRSLHFHPTRHPDRPFARVEVLYDPETRFPLQIRNYDWPEPGQKGDLLLAEHYLYQHLNLDADLTALDFDPANPAYAFHRY